MNRAQMQDKLMQLLKECYIDLPETEKSWHTIDAIVTCSQILNCKDLGKLTDGLAMVMATVVGLGGWPVDAFKAGTLGRLLRSGKVVVYKGMAYSADVWE